MVKTYAILEDSVIVNVLVCEEADQEALFPGAIDITDLSPQPQIGFVRQEDGSYLCRMEAMPLEELRAQIYAEFDGKTKAYILDHYELERQVTLGLYLMLAMVTGLTNRAAYISPALSWVEGILSYHFAKLAEINAANSNEELLGITWDLSQFDETDPVVLIEEAIGITD